MIRWSPRLAGTTTLPTPTATITNSDSVNRHTLTVNQATVTTAFAGSITGNLNLTKTANGTLNLTGASNITGALAVNGGTVAIATSTVGSASTATGGTLAVQGAANTPSALTVLNSLTLPGTTTLSLDITGTTAGSSGTAGGFSQVFVSTGTVTLGSNIALTLNGYAPSTAGDTFDIINNAGGSAVVGTFANAVPDPFGGNTPQVVFGNVTFDISYASGPTGNDVVLTVVAVPEPGSLAAVISGLGMLVGLQRFRRRS